MTVFLVFSAWLFGCEGMTWCLLVFESVHLENLLLEMTFGQVQPASSESCPVTSCVAVILGTN
jgi:hypothetical protein